MSAHGPRRLAVAVSLLWGVAAGFLAPVVADQPHSSRTAPSESATRSAPPTRATAPDHPIESLGGDPCQETRARVRRLERQITFFRAVAQRSNAMSKAAPWTDAAPQLWQPAEFEKRVAAALERRGLAPATLDCGAPPCMAQLPVGTTDEEFQAIAKELDEAYGEERRYAYKGFFPSPEAPQDKTSGEAFVLAYVTPDTNVDDERAQMLGRADAYVAELTELSEPQEAGGPE